jgi:propionate CoA-transferase
MRHIVSADDAIRRIPDGAAVLVNPMPCEEVLPAFARVYEATGSPRDLTVIWAAGLGPFSDEARGMNHFAVPGMVKRVVAGHVGLNYKLVKMIAANECEAYNLPQGVMTQLYREIAAKRPGLITRIGIGTFVDPRLEGGKLNERTRACEDLVKAVQFNGREYLFYPSFRVDAGLVRGTAVDPAGNITCDDEALTMENLEVAMAVKNCGGFVIAQVGEVLDEQVSPHAVHVPDILVDCVVVGAPGTTHPHTLFVDYDPTFSGKQRAPLETMLQPMPLNIEKVICRRAAMELRRDMIVNLGVGIPMGVAPVAHEEKVLGLITLTTEVGVIGGLPEGGRNFGPARNPRAIIAQPSMFDFYDGGGLDLTCVGLAQADCEGNVNVSKLGPRIIGCGGFINITQSAKRCVFCGEFTAGGLEAEVRDGGLVIHREGKVAKIVQHVEQITFSGAVARSERRNVLYVTERCVLRLEPDGLVLAEVAPGVDVQRDIVQQAQCPLIVPDEIPPMIPAIFQPAPMGLAEQLAG